MSSILFFLPFFILSCKTTEINFTPDQTVISLENLDVLPPNRTLANEEVDKDIQFLKYVLKNGYGGYSHLPDHSGTVMIDSLSKLRGSFTPIELKDRIDEILFNVPDNHLWAHIDFKGSPQREAYQPKGNVGKNIYSNDKKPWFVELRKIKNKKILTISIISFPSHEDPIWTGFLKAVESKLTKSELILVDMRGNGGGDDTLGLEMAQILHGGKFRYPLQTQYKNLNPVARAIYLNGYGVKILKRKIKKEPVPPHYWTIYNNRKTEFEKSKNSSGESKEDLGTYNSTDVSTQNGPYKKPIYILMDKTCASSCESTIDAFEFHPSAKKIGENTGGYIHFGNVGNIILPNSKVMVTIPTHFDEYFDKRFIEKKGITPDIRIPEGQNAYTFFMEKIL